MDPCEPSTAGPSFGSPPSLLTTSRPLVHRQAPFRSGLAVRGPPGSAIETPRPPGAEALAGSPGVASKRGSAAATRL